MKYLALILLTISIAYSQSQNERLNDYLITRITEFSEIDSTSKENIESIANFISDNEIKTIVFLGADEYNTEEFSLIISIAAAHFYNRNNYDFYSSGNDYGEFHPEMLNVLKRTGLFVTELGNISKTYTLIEFIRNSPGYQCFTRRINPEVDKIESSVFIHISDNSNDGLPENNFRLKFNAPDETSLDKACAGISRDLLYLFSLLK